jgi:hypothetical protein
MSKTNFTVADSKREKRDLKSKERKILGKRKFASLNSFLVSFSFNRFLFAT